MYLVASAEAISSVLADDRDKKQFPMQSMSRALQAPDLNYLILNKLMLMLIYVARRFKR